MSKIKKDWADKAAERFYLTYAKFCQGPDATTKSLGKWLHALAGMFRNLRKHRAKLRASERRGGRGG